MIDKLFLSLLRKMKLKFYIWELRRNHPIDNIKFDTNGYLSGLLLVLPYVRVKDLEELDLIDTTLRVHAKFDVFCLALETAIECVENKNVFHNPMKPIPEEHNAYSWLLSDDDFDDRKNIEKMIDKLYILGRLVKLKEPGRSLQRALKPLCEDIDKVLDLLENV